MLTDVDRIERLRGENPERRWPAAESCARTATASRLAESTVDAPIVRPTTPPTRGL